MYCKILVKKITSELKTNLAGLFLLSCRLIRQSKKFLTSEKKLAGQSDYRINGRVQHGSSSVF